MTDGLDYENEAAFDLHYWANLGEKAISAEIEGLTSRINNTAVLLEGMAYRANYDSTENAFNALMAEDLSQSGFIYLFCENNKEFFGEKAATGTPSWYKDLLPDVKKAYDAAKSVYDEAASLVKPMATLRKAMEHVPLKPTYRYQLTTLNFYDAGFDEKLFETMNSDVKELCEFFNKEWYMFNRHSSGPNRKDKLWDHEREVKLLRCCERFTNEGDGHYTVEQGFKTDLYILDKYTLDISILGNVEDDLKEVIKYCYKATEELNETMKKLETPSFFPLVNSVLDLKNTLLKYAELHINLFRSYMERGDEAPYCFFKKELPAYSSMNGKFGFRHSTEDPWFLGSHYSELYDSAAKALTRHCKEYLEQA